MKKVTAFLLGIFLLTGCGGETLYQVEPPPIAVEGELLGAHGIVLEGKAIVQKPFESGVYTSEKEWLSAVEECGISELESVAGRYDESFFQFNSLCCLATCSSGGKDYRITDVELAITEHGAELVINASYSPAAMVNSLSGYYFLVQLNKAECSSADTISLSEHPRLI
ncbi:MAG: hypothetical protein IJZ47_13350 [Oscillospiraceae bacterium]|nr:hypothetical protein [Oscillospiraceae bacterium]MBQ8196335.1 hypothetical protein [Oscillospiraceae bacterium]